MVKVIEIQSDFHDSSFKDSNSNDSRVGSSKSWQGSLNLTYGQRGSRTELHYSHAEAPLKVQRSFYSEGDPTCQTVMLHTAGGMVAGDRLTTTVHLQPQTQALLTTAAATKVYRSAGAIARHQIRLVLGQGATLEWLPQPMILFGQARYRQDLQVELADGASWLGWEVVRLGRTAREEEFSGGDWRSYTEVWRDELPLWIDRQWVPGHDSVLQTAHGLAGCPVVGTLAWVGQPVPSSTIAEIRQLPIEANGEPSTKTSSQLGNPVGVTRLEAGLVCRYRGHSTQAAQRWFLKIWQLVRSSFWNRSACLPRVWQL